MASLMYCKYYYVAILIAMKLQMLDAVVVVLRFISCKSNFSNHWTVVKRVVVELTVVEHVVVVKQLVVEEGVLIPVYGVEGAPHNTIS